MTISAQLITADQLWDMPHHGGRSELVNGELRHMPPTGPEHGSVTYELGFLLGVHVRAKKLGKLFAAETGFVIRQNPDTLRAADITFVSTARIPATGLPKKFWRIAPDLAVEVASPSDTLSEIEEKIDDWLDGGTQLVWLVSPTRRTVTVYRKGQSPRVVEAQDVLTGDDIVPGFSVAVADIFN